MIAEAATNEGASEHSLFGTVALALVMFMYLFNISFAAMPSPSTQGMVIRGGTLLCAGAVLRAIPGFVRANVGSLCILGMAFLYALLQAVLDGFAEPSQLVRVFAVLLYCVYGSVLLATIFRDVGTFMRACTIACVLQAVMVGVSFVFPGYRTWLASLVVQSGSIDIVEGLRPPGFSNSSGALLSIVQSLGVFAALYGAYLTRLWWQRILYDIAALVIAASTILVGRTGLILSAVFFGVFLVQSLLVKRFDLLLVLLCVGGVLASSGAALLKTVSGGGSGSLDSILDWAFEFFRSGTATGSYTDLAAQSIPPLSPATVVGTGRVIADQTWLANASGNDAGYIQTYYALGIVMTAFLYGGVLLLLGRYVWAARDRVVFAMLVVAIFAIEAKEPFLFKSPVAFFALTALRLSAPRPEITPAYA